MLKVPRRVPSERLWPRRTVHFQPNRSAQERVVAQRLAKRLAVVGENIAQQGIAARNIDTVKILLAAHLLRYIGNTEVPFALAWYFGTAQ